MIFRRDPKKPNQIFVFGSNLAGRHGKGAALEAKKFWGAQPGVGVGPTGNSYALPTKDQSLRPLPLDEINQHVREFILYAKENWHLEFLVSKVGCGLAGYPEDYIAPMFKNAPDNCVLPEGWRK